MSGFDRVLARIETGFNLIAAFSIFVLMFLGVGQVLGRKLLNMPIFGYLDIVEQAIALFAFLGIAYCQRLGGHIRMELLLTQLRGRALWLAEALGIVLALAVVAILIENSFGHFLRAYEFGDSTIDAEIPVWPSKLLVPVAFSLLWLRLVLQLVEYGRLALDPDSKPRGVPTIAALSEQAQREIQEAGVDDAPPQTARGGS